jgi:tRNA/tmRNA/rRNA uracil-C5-methylase (TrmA/RlmC/RlmD family)
MGVDNVEFVTERAETAREHIEQAYVVVVDPPRSGLIQLLSRAFWNRDHRPALRVVPCRITRT